MAKTFDDKKIIYTMDRVSRAYGTKVVLKDISISYYYGAKIGVAGAGIATLASRIVAACTMIYLLARPSAKYKGRIYLERMVSFFRQLSKGRI